MSDSFSPDFTEDNRRASQGQNIIGPTRCD